MFDEVSAKLKNKDYHLNSDDFTRIGSIYLRLFDTLPVYDHVQDEDEDSWTILLNSKYLASMLVRTDQIHFGRTKNAIHRWRYHMQTEMPEFFRDLIDE